MFVQLPFMGILLLLPLIFSSRGKVTWASSMRMQLGSDTDEAPMELTVVHFYIEKQIINILLYVIFLYSI